MPTIILAPEADVATRRDSAIAAGAGDHLPIGYWSGAIYRSAMRFPIPSWADWTGITKATLTFYISDHQHVGVRNSSIYVRKNGGTLWTKSAGTQDCESGFSAGNNTQADDLPVTTTNQVVFASGTSANAKKSVSVTLMTREYFAEGASKLVYIFDPATSSDYAELWSREKGSTYDAELEIEYTTGGPPTAPTLGGPSGTITDTTPTFGWTHHDPDGDPQVNADIEVHDDGPPTIYSWSPAVGSASSMDAPIALPTNVPLKWRARTYDASGPGAWSAFQTFTITGPPVVTLLTARRMVFSNGAPRLVAEWTASLPQTAYRVTAPGYDSGLLTGPATSHVLSTLALTSGTPVTITVASTAATGTGTGSRSYTPRFGLTAHRKDLVTVPAAWIGATVDQDVPEGATLQMEYGSAATAIAAPTGGWFTSLAAVPLRRHLFWRAWFIPSATAGPTLKKLVVTTSAALSPVDKWGTTQDVAVLVAPWSIDAGESVYGTRSMRADITATGESKVYAFKVKLRDKRNYILTGLMKSEDNSGAHFRLEKPDGSIIYAVGLALPSGDMKSPVLDKTTDWYDPTHRDTNRYRTPVYASTADQEVYVVCVVDGVVGAKAWFDAIKLEESTVATPWSPGAIGATVIDAGGVQIDATRGGVFRYKGSDGGPRDVVTGGEQGLTFGGDTKVYSPALGTISVNGKWVSYQDHVHAGGVAVTEGAFAHGASAIVGVTAATVLKLDTLDSGDAAYLNVANNRFVVPAGKAGLYRVTASVAAANTASGERHIASIVKNAVTSLATSYGYPNVAGTAGFSLAVDVQLAAGDVITFTGASTVAADWTVSAASFFLVAASTLIVPASDVIIDPTYGDDFRGAVLDAKWARHNQVVGEESYQQGRSMSALKVTHGVVNVAEYIYQVAPNGTNETWEADVSWYQDATTNQMFGIVMVDATGKGVAAHVYDNTGGLYISNLTAHVYTSLLQFLTGGRPGKEYYQGGGRITLRLRKAGTLYAASYSIDGGETFSREVSGTPAAFTPTRIGIGRFLGNNANSFAYWHSFDKTA